MGYYNQQTLQAMLDRYKKQQPTQEVPNYENYQPQELSYQKPVTHNIYEQLQDIAMQQDDQVTATALIEAANRQNQKAYQDALQQHQQAQQAYVPAISPGATQNYGPRWGKDNIPEVSDIRHLHPNAPLVTENFHGQTFTVNRQVAPIFMAFLNDLWKMGYKPKSIQGNVERNIAGTNTPSLHSYGFAIDIDPSRNPVYHDSNSANDVYALPPSVGALAAKYGLSWGGNWRTYKDYMHFSVPYGGTQ